MNRDLIDPDDFCRPCRGQGTVEDHDGTHDTCDDCRGTGKRTVRLGPKTETAT